MKNECSIIGHNHNGNCLSKPLQEKLKPSLCNDCFDENHCLGKVKGCECYCQEEQPMEEWEKEFNITTKRAVLYIGENSPASRLLVEEIREQIIMFLAHQKEQQKIRIGMLRQWLNEDRITDTKKMVSNEDIIYWLNLK